jgi:hypothetical protein
MVLNYLPIITWFMRGLGWEVPALLSSPHPTHPSLNCCPNTSRIYNIEIGSETQNCGIFFLPGVFATVLVLCICPDDSYIKPQEKKFNLFFIKVQLLPCQSNPFISPSLDCSCQPVITVCYLDNSLLIIPTSEKLPIVNYIATNEAQMHLLQCPLLCFLSLCHAQEPNHSASAGIWMSSLRKPRISGPALAKVCFHAVTTWKLGLHNSLGLNIPSPKVWESY